MPWLRVTALVLGGFVAGLWVDWLLRKLDRSRNAAREKIGSEMQELANKLESASASAQGFPPYYPELMSLLLKVLKHGIWTPVESIHRAEYRPAIWVYLTLVGTLLRDGHFDMARQAAWVLKNTFERASAEQK